MALTAGEFLAGASRLPLLPASTLPDWAPAIVLAPHPDDESLACGGLIARLRAHGASVRLVVVSDGAASHPQSREFPPPRLRELRRRELLAAAHELDLPSEDVSFLDLPDGRVPHPGDERFAPALRRLEEAADGVQACVLVASWRFDPHGDHVATYELARALQRRLRARPRLLEYVVWGWTLPPEFPVHDEPPCGVRLAAGPAVERKRRAIACHRSQLGQVVRDDPFKLDAAMVARFTDQPELFLEMPP